MKQSEIKWKKSIVVGFVIPLLAASAMRRDAMRTLPILHACAVTDWFPSHRRMSPSGSAPGHWPCGSSGHASTVCVACLAPTSFRPVDTPWLWDGCQPPGDGQHPFVPSTNTVCATAAMYDAPGAAPPVLLRASLSLDILLELVVDCCNCCHSVRLVKACASWLLAVALPPWRLSTAVRATVVAVAAVARATKERMAISGRTSTACTHA